MSRRVRAMTSQAILLIDNDPGLLGVLTLELELAHYDVQSFASAEAALASRLEPPDLAVLDYQLPGMNGLALLEKLRQIYPALPALIISSECSPERIPAGPEPPATALLRKPFAQGQFIRHVHDLLMTGNPT